MDRVITGFENLIKALQGYAIRVSLPIFIFVSVILAIWFSFASDQNKQRIKISYFVILVAAVLIIVVPVVIPWVQSFFG